MNRLTHTDTQIHTHSHNIKKPRVFMISNPPSTFFFMLLGSIHIYRYTITPLGYNIYKCVYMKLSKVQTRRPVQQLSLPTCVFHH